MSRKTLLTEAEVRQFLKLANIGPVGDVKLDEMYGSMPGARDDEDALEDEEPMADLGADDDLGDTEDDLGDLGADDELDADPADDLGGAQMVSVEDFMGALERALEDVLSDEVDIDMDDEEELDAADDLEDDAGEMDAMALDMDDEEDEMMEGEAAPRRDDEEEDSEEEEAARAAAAGKAARGRMRGRDRRGPGIKGITREAQDDVVEQVARRVFDRLQSKQSKEKMVEELTEKIFARITAK